MGGGSRHPLWQHGSITLSPAQPCLRKTPEKFCPHSRLEKPESGERDDKLGRKSVCVRHTTHLVLLLRRGRRVNERQLHHRLPGACTWTFSRHLKLNRFVQVRLLGGKNGAVRPHAEERLAAAQDHRFIPPAVVEGHWRQADRT